MNELNKIIAKLAPEWPKKLQCFGDGSSAYYHVSPDCGIMVDEDYLERITTDTIGRAPKAPIIGVLPAGAISTGECALVELCKFRRNP
jgi:hypothetical protein